MTKVSILVHLYNDLHTFQENYNFYSVSGDRWVLGQVELCLNKGETDSVEIRWGVKPECCPSPKFSTYVEETLAELRDFKIAEKIINKMRFDWWKIINKMRFAHYTTIIVKTQDELQSKVKILVDTEGKMVWKSISTNHK